MNTDQSRRHGPICDQWHWRSEPRRTGPCAAPAGIIANC